MPSLLLNPDGSDICISRIYSLRKDPKLCISYDTSSLTISALNLWTFWMWKITPPFFVVVILPCLLFMPLSCWLLQQELEMAFTGIKVRGQQTPKSLHRIVSESTGGLRGRPRKMALQEEFYFLPKVHIWVDHNSKYILSLSLSGCLWSVMIPLIFLTRHFLHSLHVRLSHHNNLMVSVYYYFPFTLGKMRHQRLTLSSPHGS